MHFKEKLELYGNGKNAAIAEVEKSLPIGTVRFPLKQLQKLQLSHKALPLLGEKSAMPWPH